MSEKKPPPRPPLPRQGSGGKPPSGANTGAGRLRNALASISIRYNPTNAQRESDSEEEISIVRKAEANCDGENHEIAITSSESENASVTTYSCIRPGSKLEETSKQIKAGSEASLKQAAISAIGAEKNHVVKQRSWPISAGNFRIEKEKGPNSSGAMRFLRREGRQANTTQSSKVNEAKEETADAGSTGSQPSQTHLSLKEKDRESTSRSRSPSPFRRLHRHTQEATERLTASCSPAISLSSLLAAAKDDSSTDPVKENVEVEEEEFQDALPELSPPSRLSNYEDIDIFLESPDLPSHVYEPHYTLLSVSVLLTYTYFITTPPVFVNGMVFGFLVAYLVGCVVLWILCPEDSAKERFERELKEYNRHIANAPKRDYTSIDPGLLLRPRELKGWMYKAYDYDPSTVSETTPVFAQLKGTKLTLSHPKLNPNKKLDPRTLDDNASIPFNRHDSFDLTGGKVSLVPPTITKKRIWSKKYPLLVMLDKPGKVTEEIKEVITEDNGKSILQKMRSQTSFEDISILYLFARTGREKEEWYQYFSKLMVSNKEETISDLDYLLRPSCSYPHYMAKLLPVIEDTSGEGQQVQLSWVNMLFGRVFWDVWQDRYWADKITQRFQNKLSKLHKPQFIRDISIKDLSLGNSLPIISRVSLPVLDERGTWIDFDVTYSGGLVFTLETYLNVDGYLSYFLNLGNEIENKEISADLEMAELSRKYEMMEEEERSKDILEEDAASLTSESPPESDSDFESPESDLEEFNIRLSSGTESDLSPDAMRARPEFVVSRSTDSSSDRESLHEESNLAASSNSMTSFQISSESLTKSDSISIELNSTGRVSPVQKQSSNEDEMSRSEPGSPTPGSGPSSPIRRNINNKPNTKRKVISVIERLAKSKWVKKAAETKIVKSAAEKFSNLPIILSVEVQTVKGTLAINIPPPPTNRLWYGFRGNPKLFVSARPKLGARQVKLTHVTDWIEKKLKQEFKNMFVLPNMEDLPIKLMKCDVEQQFEDS